MRGRAIALSPARRFICDLLDSAAAVPTVPVQRRMQLGDVVLARRRSIARPCWPALFIKAFARVCDAMPQLRRSYVKFPWPHLYEHPASIANIAVEKDYLGQKEVFLGRIKEPAQRSLEDIDRAIEYLKEVPVDKHDEFRRTMRLSRMPGLVRRAAWWLGLNVDHLRQRHFGTFALSTYSSLGAESLHPLSPLTTTLNYGVIGENAEVDVRLVYDHRVLNGAEVARALARLEAELTGPTLAELQGKEKRWVSAYIPPLHAVHAEIGDARDGAVRGRENEPATAHA